MTNIEKELASIKKDVDEIKDTLVKKKLLNPRKIAEEITEGKRAPMHLGGKTPEVVIQEVKSFVNSNDSQAISTMSNKEKAEALETANNLAGELKEIFKENPTNQARDVMMNLQKVVELMR